MTREALIDLVLLLARPPAHATVISSADTMRVFGQRMTHERMSNALATLLDLPVEIAGEVVIQRSSS